MYSTVPRGEAAAIARKSHLPIPQMDKSTPQCIRLRTDTQPKAQQPARRRGDLSVIAFERSRSPWLSWKLSSRNPAQDDRTGR
jgi:hypothetical protein